MPAWVPNLPTTPPGGILCIGLRLRDDPAWLADCHSYCYALVSAEEQLRARRYAHREDAVHFLLSRIIVRQAIQTTLGPQEGNELAYTPLGKPYCPSSGIHFSIAHARRWVWVALCRESPVGIDVESLRPLPRLTEFFTVLHPQERNALASIQDRRQREMAFYRCWTRKEAVLKALGQGLCTPLDSFAVDVGPQHGNWIVSLPASTLTHCLPPDAWTSWELNSDDKHICNVAAALPGLQPQETSREADRQIVRLRAPVVIL